MTHATAFRPAWTPLTILLMVLGFVAYWPLGLAVLAYILWGDRLERMVRDAGDQFGAESAGYGRSENNEGSGNAAFDDYRARELERLEAERRRLDAMRDEFDDFMRNLRHARDREEFDRFMADNRRRGGPAAD